MDRTSKLKKNVPIMYSHAVPAEDAPWVCSYCGTFYVVPTLARLCEDKHKD